MRTRLRKLSLVALCVVFPACGNLFDSAAAVVNGQKITTAKVESELDRFRKTTRYEQLTAQGPVGEIERSVEQDYLSLLIREAVLEEEAEERGIEVTPEDVTARVDELKTQFTSEGQFEEALKEEGIGIEQLEFQVRTQLLEERLRDEVVGDIGPPDSQIADYYEEHIDEYQEVHVQHILVSDEREAQSIATKLQKAKTESVDELFETLAKQRSEDPTSADKAGDLGLAPPSKYVKTFRNAVANLEVGQVSDPVKTELGYHIIRLLGRQVTPLEDVRSTIVETLAGDQREDAFNEWLTRAYVEADVRVNPAYGELDIDSHTVTNASAEHVPAGVSPRPSASPEP